MNILRNTLLYFSITLCLTAPQLDAGIPIDPATMMGGAALVASTIYGYFHKNQPNTDIIQALSAPAQVHGGKAEAEQAQQHSNTLEVQSAEDAEISEIIDPNTPKNWSDLPELQSEIGQLLVANILASKSEKDLKESLKVLKTLFLVSKRNALTDIQELK